MKEFTTCLWFNHDGLEAVDYYCEIFPEAKKGEVTYFDNQMREASGEAQGNVLTVEFTLGNQKYMCLNGGDMFPLTEAVSIVVDCDTQEEVDVLWNRFIQDGGTESQCGWLKDKFGMSWQIVPKAYYEMFSSSDQDAVNRMVEAMLKMQKLDVHILRQAFDNK